MKDLLSRSVGEVPGATSYATAKAQFVALWFSPHGSGFATL